jgi:hypothetical protein
MRKLVNRIKRELQTAKHCAVYNDELSRVWPHDGERREAQIARFAHAHGWRLRYYRDGFCAIFDEEPRRRTSRARYGFSTTLTQPSFFSEKIAYA